MGSRSTNPDEQINTSVQFYVMIGFLSLLANYLMIICWDTAANRQVKRIRNKLFHNIIRQDMEFFDENTPGDLNNVISG